MFSFLLKFLVFYLKFLVFCCFHMTGFTINLFYRSFIELGDKIKGCDKGD